MSLADQIASDLAAITSNDDHTISATFKPQGSSDESSWISISVMPHPGEQSFISQDGELVTYEVRMQHFSFLDGALSSLGRAPARGDVIAIDAGQFIGEWTVQYRTPQLYMHAVACVDHHEAGMGAPDAVKMVQ